MAWDRRGFYFPYPVKMKFLAVAALPLFAQSNTATILGNVTDSSGASIPGVKVTITNVKTHVARSTVTGESGAFELPLIPVGEYAVAAEMTSFRRAERTGILLDAGQKAKIDFRLQVGEVVESVTVNAGTSLLATQTSERGVVIGAGQVDNLPLNGRNFTQLISLEPGVVVGGQINGAITFNGGARRPC